MIGKHGFVSNSLVQFPQNNDILVYDDQQLVWKNVPFNSMLPQSIFWRVSRLNTFSISPSTNTQLPFDTMLFELPLGSFNLSTGEFTCPIDGIYWLEATVRWTAAPASGIVYIIAIQRNTDASKAPRDYQVSTTSFQTTTHCSGSWHCAAGDKLSVVVSHNHTSSQTVNGNHFTTFSGFCIAPYEYVGGS
jgi:hypothetical protein